VNDYAKALSIGFKTLDMIPDVMAEGKDWRFIGIQAKNQLDWLLIHFANMYQRTTTVALYDTLGVEATKFCINQTRMVTIAGTLDMLHKLCKIKKEETESGATNLARIKFFIVMGCETVPQADRTVFEDHGLTVYTIGDVHKKG